MNTVGVIGGSGLYDMTGLEDVERVRLTTPFGEPSDEFVCGTLADVRLIFLPRHGRGHRILPSEINFRANIYGMKKLGAEWVIGVGAVGSLREEIHPGHLVVPDQLIDRTFRRQSTFFGNGIVAHVTFAEPFCPVLSTALVQSARKISADVHARGTYVCMEGPQFSTRAESFLYRQWGADVIGMTNLQEAKLAREAEICYATVAMVTDYDCWHPAHDEVTVDQIIAVLNKNAENACNVVREAVAAMPRRRTCKCGSALATAIITSREAIPAEARTRLKLLIGKYIGESGSDDAKKTGA